jgi:carboxypeptidase C (cathepsin A)
MFGLYWQIGPIIINEDLSVSVRKESWNQKVFVFFYNFEAWLVFVDNPFNTGFSYSDAT